MPLPTMNQLRQLLAPHPAPCLSVYMPTHRTMPDNQQDHILYKNLLRQLEDGLRQQYPARDFQELILQFQQLTDNVLFWANALDGLAVLGCPDTFQVFTLPRRVDSLAVVAESFHVKPLLRMLQTADRFHVLCLSNERVKLYEASRYSIEEIDLSGTPLSLTEGLSPALEQGRTGNTGLDDRSNVRHAEDRANMRQLDQARFFPLVDRVVLERFSHPTQMPVVLACLPEFQSEFRKGSHNPHLAEEGINQHPFSMSPQELQEAAWKVMQQRYQQRLTALVDNFQVARARQQASDDLTEVAAGAVIGRVGVLLVDADQHVPGRFDRNTGQIQPGEFSQPGVDDLLDDVAEMVLQRDGQVVVMPSDRMPTRTGLAAVYRY